MKVMPFIPKSDRELPDFYKVKIEFVNGKTKEFEIVEHSIRAELPSFDKTRMIPLSVPVLEIVTREDEYKTYVLSSINGFELDKNFSTMMEIRKKKMQERMKREAEKKNENKA